MSFNAIRNFLANIGDTSQTLERALIDVISAVTPWLAPIIPASMAHSSMIERLHFDSGTALVGALAVEFLGLTSINTAVEFWRYNTDKSFRSDTHVRKPVRTKLSRLERIFGRKHRRTNGAPLLLAMLTGGFYIAVVLTVNAVLDVGYASNVQIAAKVGLSLLSVVSGVIIALRASHSRQTTKKIVVKASPVAGKPKSVEVQIRTRADYWRINESRNGQGPVSAAELVSKHGIKRSTAYEWQADWHKSHIPNLSQVESEHEPTVGTVHQN